MPLTINSLWGGHIHTHFHMLQTKSNQVHANLWPVHVWFEKLSIGLVTPCIFIKSNLTVQTVSQPKHPWCKKVASNQELKKDQDKKDVKSNWAAKASCC